MDVTFVNVMLPDLCHKLVTSVLDSVPVNSELLDVSVIVARKTFMDFQNLVVSVSKS